MHWVLGVGSLGWLTALTVCDVRTQRLPNVLTLPGAVAIIGAATLAGNAAPAFAGALALFGAYLTVHLIAPTGLGAGDVKLAIGLGALTGSLGVGAWTCAAVGGPLLTVAAAAVARRAALPHGPGMCAASAVVVGCAYW